MQPNWVRSVVLVVLHVAVVVPYAFFLLLCRPFPLRVRYRMTAGFPKFVLWSTRLIGGIRWEVEGWENLPDGPAILLPKHQSAWETLWLMSTMPREVVFVYKRELNWLPFFGWGLSWLDMISIDRRRGASAFEQVVEQGANKLDDGRWIVIFPEGTRTAPGSTKRYKTGGARLASRTGALVVPIALNSGECWPRHPVLRKSGTITVRIGPPIRGAGRSADEIGASVESWIETQMRDLAPHRYTGPYVADTPSSAASSAPVTAAAPDAPGRPRSPTAGPPPVPVPPPAAA
jgi:1-acyl-sn-glycerol-3-phosphate acyltransferase